MLLEKEGVVGFARWTDARSVAPVDLSESTRETAGMLLQLLLALGLLLRTSSAAGQCTSWCHWDWEKNCKSSQCSGCVDCVSQRVGRAACDAGIKNDFTYEECDPTCQKATCNMCKCKACVSCGGSPPVAQSVPQQLRWVMAAPGGGWLAAGVCACTAWLLAHDDA